MSGLLPHQPYPGLQNNNGDIYFLLTADGTQELHELALRIFRDLTGTVLPHRFPRILISCGQPVSDIPELTSSASNASLASALSLLGEYPPYFYEGYLQNQDLITQLQDICSSIYRDYLSSDREKLYVDSASYAAFLKIPSMQRLFCGTGPTCCTTCAAAPILKSTIAKPLMKNSLPLLTAFFPPAAFPKRR